MANLDDFEKFDEVSVDLNSLSPKSEDFFRMEKDIFGYNESDPFISSNIPFTPASKVTIQSSLPRIVRPDKKRRITPTFLGSATCLFPDIKDCTEACMLCKMKGTMTVFGKFPLCNVCSPHTVGITLDHSKLPLIVSLRKEVVELTELRNQFTGQSVLTSEINRRIREIQKVIVTLVDYRVDLTHLTTL